MSVLGAGASAAGLVALAFGVLSADMSLGLVTRFVDVVVPNVSMGRTYDISRVQSQVFSVTNTSREPLSIAVEKEVPAPVFLKPGYEPIPDAAWIDVKPSRFNLKPGERRTGRVRLRVPKDAQWRGRHFQAALWTRSSEGPLAVGVRSFVRFSVEADAPVAVPRELDHGLKFETLELNGVGVKPGVRTKIGQVVLRNDSDVARRVALRGVRPTRIQRKGDLPTPNPDFLRVSPNDVEIEPMGSVLLGLFGEVPAGGAHSGKSYAFSIRGDVKELNGLSVFTDLSFHVNR